MFSSTRRIRLLIVVAFLLTAASLRADEPAAVPSGNNPVPTATQGAVFADFDSDGDVDIVVSGGGPSHPQSLSEFWIGIDGTPPDDALRAQLELPAGQGLVVNQVVDDGPAAKAGLKRFDVLLACLDKPLTEVADLAKIIEEKKDAVLPIKLIRGGRQIIVEVTPQRRPPSQTGETCPAISKADDETFLRRVWLDVIGSPPDAAEVQKFADEKREKKREWLVNRLLRKSTLAARSCTACHANDVEGIRLYQSLPLARWNVNTFHYPLTDVHGSDALYIRQFVGLPGAFIDAGGGAFIDVGAAVASEATPKLPDDVSVSLTLKGSEPPKIMIRKGDDWWGVSRPDDFQNLPENARGYVRTLLVSILGNAGSSGLLYEIGDRGNLAAWLRKVEWLPRDQTERPGPTNAGAAPAAAAQPPTSSAETAFDRLDRQLESLASQLGELRKSMHDLHQTMRYEKGKPAGEKK
jgi:hypothetical protein